MRLKVTVEPASTRSESVRPIASRMTRLPLVGRRRAAVNTDRLLNRFWHYPRHLRRRRADFDLYHLCDHSYSQLALELPPERIGIFCHDLDTFRCVLEPQRERRPYWFRLMVKRILHGFQQAAVVFHTTGDVRREILRHGLIDSARLVKAPLGVAPEFTREGDTDEATLAALNIAPTEPFLLHVGSCIPRKRIDVLLEMFATLRPGFPALRLVKVGGPWAPAHRDQLARLRLEHAVIQRIGLTRSQMAALYRRAALVLLPSESEGFGLPVIEALACGATVVASDIPVLREVGGDAAVYCPVGDVRVWADAVARLVETPALAPAPGIRLAQAAHFTWATHADTILGAYRKLMGVRG